MAQPVSYDRVTSFTDYQTDNPSDPLPATSLDAELNAVKLTLDQIRQNLALIQRDDGEIVNEGVGVDQLSSEILIGFDAPTTWATATSYGLAATVFESGKFYKCLVEHVSSVFATDLADGKWSLIADFTSITATITDLQATEQSVASAATTPIGVQSTFRVAITGSTTITAFDSVANRVRFVRFTGSLTIVHNPSVLILPRGLDLNVSSGDWAIFSSDGSGVWTCEFFSRPIFPDGSVSTPSIVFSTDLDTGFYRSADNKLSVAAGGTQTCEFAASQNVSKVPFDAPSMTIGGGAVWSTGDIKLTVKTVADAGWTMMDDATIGSTAAATKFGSQYEALYTLLWTNIADTWCPVTGGRGASAAADWAAGKPLQLLKVLGRALSLSGAGAGLTTRALGQIAGGETYVLTRANLPSVLFDLQGTLAILSSGTPAIGPNTSTLATPAGSTGSNFYAATDFNSLTANFSDLKANSGGSGTAIPLVGPSSFLNAMVKL